MAFELKECYDPKLKKYISDSQYRPNGEVRFMRSGGMPNNFLEETKNKSYESAFSIELLFYTDGAIVSHPDVIIPEIKEYFNNSSHQFRRIWFMGQPDETCECILSLVE